MTTQATLRSSVKQLYVTISTLLVSATYVLSLIHI